MAGAAASKAQGSVFFGEVKMTRVQYRVAVEIISMVTPWARSTIMKRLREKDAPLPVKAMGRYSVYDLEEIADWLGQSANELQTMYSERRQQAKV